MDPNNKKSFMRAPKLPLIILGVVILAGLIGWSLGRTNDGNTNTNKTADTETSAQTNKTSAEAPVEYDIQSLVNYTLPAGWKEYKCPGTPGTIYVVPGGKVLECTEKPDSPVTIAIDPSNKTDCNQLQNVQNVSKHVCVSEYVNGSKTLKAETVYNKDSVYKQDTSLNVYYVDTGKGVVKFEYVHDPSDSQYQQGFDSLARSLTVK